MQFFWCQWEENQFIRRIHPDWKMSKGSYDGIFIKKKRSHEVGNSFSGRIYIWKLQTQSTNNLIESALDLKNKTNQQLKKRNTVLIPDFPNLQFDILNNSRVV